MKENNKDLKDNENEKKNIEIKQDNIKKDENNLDFTNINNSYISNETKKEISNKELSPHKSESIKVKLTPINIIETNNSKKQDESKDLNNTYRRENTINNNLFYSSPLQEQSLENINNTVSEIKIDNLKKYNENGNNLKEKFKKLCATPYRKINIRSKREAISPSANVIIKNFNYNNVYNINIDNDKIKKPQNNNKNNKNDINRFSHKYITYNKPKTTSNLHMPCVITKKDVNDVNSNYQLNNSVNKIKNKEKRGTFYSRFISEGKCLKNTKDNFIINSQLNINKGLKINKQNDLNKTNKKNNIINKNINDEKFNTFNFTNTERNDYVTISNIKNEYNNNLDITHKKRIASLNKTHNLSLNNNFLKFITNTPVASNPYLENKTENFSDYNIISFNLNDLNIFEEKINNIILKFNNMKDIYNIEASQECFEFINFYSKSSIKGIFTTFFKDNNKLIIESSINLSLFSIIIIYHLSTNNFCSNEITNIINNILLLFKINFALYIKKIQLNYKIDNTKKNYIYFEPFNNFLKTNKILDIEKEEDITYKIYQNCKEMTNNIKLIMEYYKKINTTYYNNFIRIFNNISIKNENELLNYFFTKMSNNSLIFITVNKDKNDNKNNNVNLNKRNKLKRFKTNASLSVFSPKKKSIFENLSIKRDNNNVFKKSFINSIKRKKKEKINKIIIPYIKESSNKKYTLILDLNKTLAYINKKGNLKLRNGLFSFLSMVKSYYELISFSCEPKQITEIILKEIESEKKYFDYNFYREHSILYENSLVKDISLIGRDISKIIIIDDDENCFKLNKENGIKIAPFNENIINDNILFELKKILILIYKKNYNDVRDAIKEFSNDIKHKISIA